MSPLHYRSLLNVETFLFCQFYTVHVFVQFVCVGEQVSLADLTQLKYTHIVHGQFCLNCSVNTLRHTQLIGKTIVPFIAVTPTTCGNGL